MTRLVPLLTLVAALAACDNTPTTAPVGDRPAAPTPSRPADDDAGAGFASPKQADPPAAEPVPGGPPDPELAARIKERFGERCRYERACGELVGVDCDAAVDGPYYYVTRADLKTVSTCGGACMGGRCTDCPPKAWTCPTY
ncbi:MAG: hypothetical protein JNL82_24815 [Myxococcales bacterium]|nr:hypothetical protein [Myxococcales bacterium]